MCASEGTGGGHGGSRLPLLVGLLSVLLLQVGQQGRGMRAVAAAGRYSERNAYAVAQGKLFYRWFNCIGCHAQGGGAIGPALMDESWIYGKDPDSIFATIC